MLSVVTLTYNRANLVEETIRSVLAQDFADFEYLLVDDGSTDHTEEVIRSIGDARLKYFRLPHSGKISALRNFALRQSKGEFIAFIDSDDSWESHKLAEQVKAMQANPSLGFVFSDVLLMEGNVQRKLAFSAAHTHSIPTSFLHEILANRLSIYPSSLLFRKEAIEKAGRFNEDMIAGDMDLVTRVAGLYPGFLVPSFLVKIKMHDQNHSVSHEVEAHLERISTLKYFRERKMVNAFMYRKVTAFHLRYLAGLYMASGDRTKARDYFFQSLLLNPLSRKGVAGWIQTTIKG